MQQAQTYRERSREYLSKAFRELADGDLPQASEKGWGAAAQMVKAVADQRGMAHHSHALLLQIAYALEQETGDAALGELFDAANSLHGNFYEGQDDLSRRTKPVAARSRDSCIGSSNCCIRALPWRNRHAQTKKTRRRPYPDRPGLPRTLRPGVRRRRPPARFGKALGGCVPRRHGYCQAEGLGVQQVQPPAQRR